MKKEITTGIIVIALIVITAIFIDTYYINAAELCEDEPDVVLSTPISPIPEIGSFLLFTCGLVCLGFLMLVLKL